VHGRGVVPQGLNWYRERLREDRDGDTADEFLVEPSVAPAQPAAPAAAQRASACAGAADAAAAPAQASASALKVCMGVLFMKHMNFMEPMKPY